MKQRIFLVLIVVIVLAGGSWMALKPDVEADGLVGGNGRIEATEIDLATKIAGRLEEVLVNEGDFVEEGQVLATIQSDQLSAQLTEAEAQQRESVNAVAGAEAQVAAREADKLAAEAVVTQRESELAAEEARLKRTEKLVTTGAAAEQDFDDIRAKVLSYGASIKAAEAQVAAAEAAILAAKAQVKGAQSTVEATEATIARIQSDLEDCQLKSPRAGRVQYRVSQAGEVLGVGGKVLNLVDLSDVYMTFFIPETTAGRIAIGSEVRILLDAAPEFVIPAKVSFVSSVAQFTPKTVETESERQKLMFRVKGQIDKELLKMHLEQVKTGLPGVAWLKLDPEMDWPGHLTVTTAP